jgi:large subunit ribosomal protein L25
MEKKTLTIEERQIGRKSINRKLRRNGKIPAIIYGHNKPVAISLDEHEFMTKFKAMPENVIINLDTGKNKYDVLIKDYQEDIIHGKITHIDFFEIEKGKLLRTHVPIHLDGTPIGVKEGGILEHLLHEVEVECLPKDLPETIHIDVTDLQIHHPVHIKDITAIAGVKFLNSPDQVVCLVEIKAAVEEVEEEEAAAEEEVAGEEAAAAEEEKEQEATEE